MLSDGFPQDCDYGPDRSDHEYGVADTARALAEAARAGVQTFCVTVDRSGHDYLKRMCPDDRYLLIEEIEALPDALTKVYQKLTAYDGQSSLAETAEQVQQAGEQVVDRHVQARPSRGCSWSRRR